MTQDELIALRLKAAAVLDVLDNRAPDLDAVSRSAIEGLVDELLSALDEALFVEGARLHALAEYRRRIGDLKE